MRKVARDVTVLITNCQLSLKPYSGPLTAHMATIKPANMKVIGFPIARADERASREKRTKSCRYTSVPPGLSNGTKERKNQRKHVTCQDEVIDRRPGGASPR